MDSAQPTTSEAEDGQEKLEGRHQSSASEAGQYDEQTGTSDIGSLTRRPRPPTKSKRTFDVPQPVTNMEFSGEEFVHGFDTPDAKTKPVALVSRLVDQMDIDNPDNLKTITFSMLNYISEPDEEWQSLWESPEFADFLNRCVEIKACSLNLDKFLLAHEKLRLSVPLNVSQKIASDVLESQQPVRRADKVWQEDEIPERFRRNKDTFVFALKGQRISQVERATAAALDYHARQAIIQASTEDIEKCLKQALYREPCGECDFCKQVVDLQYPLQKMADWKDIKKSIEHYRESARQSILRKSIQEHSTSVEQERCRAEFYRDLMKGLKTRMTDCNAGPYTLQQREDILEGLFRELDTLALQKDGRFSLKGEFAKDLCDVYSESPQVAANFIQPSLSLDEILDQSANASVKTKTARLKKTLRKELEKLLELSETERYHSELLVELKQAVASSLSEFSFKTQNLPETVRSRVHAWAQQQLLQRLEKIHAEWNKRHSARATLNGNKLYYKDVTNAVFTTGFTHKTLAQLMAHSMLSCVRNSATKAEVSKRVLSVLSLPWLASAESIRRKYFVELAEQVQNGNRQRALRHCRQPKEEIEAWYASEIQKEYEKPARMFEEEFEKQFDTCLRGIFAAGGISDIVAATKFDETVAAEWFKCEDVGPAELADFRDNVIAALNEERRHYESRECSYSPSENTALMLRLGCTKVCFWCGALCWGERGHEFHHDETKVHFSSHQPTGLHGTRKMRGLSLMADSCHMWKDDLRVNIGELRAVPWKTAKTEYFADWNFERHYDDNLDEMMRWFLQELHIDLAQSADHTVHPVTTYDLKQYGCAGLKLVKILQQIEQ